MRDIQDWRPEDESFWENSGKLVARRNLWVSIPALFCGFAVWVYWGIITVQMLNLGFPIPKEQLFTLTAIAGISGATLRIPNSFFIRLCGGRNTIFFTTLLLILPALGTGIALQNKDTPLWLFQLLALLSGFGGGVFSSSMSNISFFYPRQQQGLALGLNGGLGNFGVTGMQVLIPLFMTFGIFGGEPMILLNTSGTVIGKIAAGTPSWIHNAGYLWLIFLLPVSVSAWFGMNNLNTPDITPEVPSLAKAMGQMSVMMGIALLTTVAGLWLMLPAEANGSGWQLPKELVLALVIVITVVLLRALPAGVGRNVAHQYRVFKNHHTWVMSVLYVMTFGSFIGFSAAFALAIKVIFGYQHILVDGVMSHDTLNPNAPSALTYAWMAPFIGALIRPVGGWLGDKFGGALITQCCAVVMTIAAIMAGYFMFAAYQSATPEQYFLAFSLTFLLLFSASGIGNGSTFRTIAIVFPKADAGPVLGWTASLAAYGAFYIPLLIGEQIQSGSPEKAMYGLAFFYALCGCLNFWVYLRRCSEFFNP